MIKIGKHISDWTTNICQPKTKKELKDIIEDRVYNDGTNCDLNDIDISLITDTSYLFFEIDFNGDISMWDVSNVKNMSRMFYKSHFNGDISKWDVSNVEDMFEMFFGSKFNRNISKWNIDESCYTFAMFDRCPIKEEYKPKLK